ncbi:MAG TPA: hypothetical protein VE077_15515 [Candidatus Methylomirabilis sp.]|nr:hypothetical protein [Candidatus Methylomirabilis sp.]
MKTVYIALFAYVACVGSAQAQDEVYSESCWESNFTYDALSCIDPSLPSELVASPAAPSAPFAALSAALDSYPPSQSRETRSDHPVFRLGAGYDYMSFRSALFHASVNGLRTSFSYSWKDWLGVEGNVLAAFGSSTLNNEASHIVLYGAGPRFGLNTGSFQPWAHVLVGGIHVYPLTGSNVNGFAFQLGGGVDYAYKPFLSFRVESDYVRSQLYSAGQNSFVVGAGIVIPF